MDKTRTLPLDDTNTFGRRLALLFALTGVVVTTLANIAFTLAPVTMLRLVHSLLA